MTEHGIDLSRSGWGNPDNHEARKPRGVQGAPIEDPAGCESVNDDGWMCDGKPDHEGIHWADTGGMVVRWGTYEGKTADEIDSERYANAPLAEIRMIAGQAVEEGTPVKWAVALEKILEITRDA